MTEPQPAVSISRVLKIVVPVALIGIAAYVWSRTLEPSARKELATNSFTRILTSKTENAGGEMRYQDKDGDLVADAPEDPQKCINPDALVFSFIAG